jgi:hypothetical protein
VPSELIRNKPSPACASEWQLSRASLGLTSPEEQAALSGHLDACAACAARWGALQRDVDAAQGATLPLALRDAARAADARARRGPLGLWWSGLSLAAVAAALAMVVLPAPRPEPARDAVLLKGRTELWAAVQHDGAVREGAVGRLGALAPGDAVRLRVTAGQRTWQILQRRDAAGWSDLFAGEVEAGEWLPVGLRVTADAPAELRVVVCERRPPASPAADLLPAGCVAHATRL